MRVRRAPKQSRSLGNDYGGEDDEADEAAAPGKAAACATEYASNTATRARPCAEPAYAQSTLDHRRISSGEDQQPCVSFNKAFLPSR